MFLPLVHVTLPEMTAGWSPEAHFAPMTFMLEGLVRLNEWHIQQSFLRAQRGAGEVIPPLFSTGIRYQEDAQGREDWRDIPAILDRFRRTGQGCDCDNLVCWRTAELRCAGINAEPVIKWQHLTQAQAKQLGYYPTRQPGDGGIQPEGLWLVHCCVRMPNGAVEDTSKLLGMGGGYTSRV